MKPTFSIVALFACLATTAAAAAVDTPFDHAGIAETLKGKFERQLHWRNAIAMSMKCPSAWVHAATLPAQLATSDAVSDAAALLAAAKLSTTKHESPTPVFDFFDRLDRE
ncbi:hypothetical protein FQN54_006652 [Arachnomyces sp. PD_36]|nr:hypothetical protein FQN54_006652 [Arachnomyces sp. PD_36]